MATFLNDTFTGTDGDTLISTHVGETGATWTRNTVGTFSGGQFVIKTNRIYTSGVTAMVYASGTPASADYSVILNLHVVTIANINILGAAGRSSTNANTMYLAYINRVTSGGTWTVYLNKRVTGTNTSFGNFVITTPTAGSDHTLELRMVGDQISLYYDGVLQVGPVTDTAITAAGRAGIYSDIAVTTTTGTHIDTITGSDIVSSLPPPLIRNEPLTVAVRRASLY